MALSYCHVHRSGDISKYFRKESATAEFWGAHASRVLASPSSRSRTSFNASPALRVRLRQSPFRRDAETNTRDACAPPLDFLRGLRIKNAVESLWIDYSLGCCRQFSGLVSF